MNGTAGKKQTILWKFIMVLVALGSCLPSLLGRPLKNVATLEFSSSFVTVLSKIKLKSRVQTSKYEKHCLKIDMDVKQIWSC